MIVFLAAVACGVILVVLAMGMRSGPGPTARERVEQNRIEREQEQAAFDRDMRKKYPKR
jgi:hypothetical protein